MIYVITHKDFANDFLEKMYIKFFMLAQVSRKKHFFGMTQGISSFCELTGLYWIWKNAEEKADDIFECLTMLPYISFYPKAVTFWGNLLAILKSKKLQGGSDL